MICSTCHPAPFRYFDEAQHSLCVRMGTGSKVRPLQVSLKAVKFLSRPPARVCFAVLNLAMSFDRAGFHIPS
jgi:hypothetical protein